MKLNAYKEQTNSNYMLGYSELYEILRKEKYSESLQPLSKKFFQEFGEYLNEHRNNLTVNLFSEQDLKLKKQLENSLSLFKELMLKRKKKILNLAFMATETGIMKRDFENMLQVEQETFDKLVKAFEEMDFNITGGLRGQETKTDENKMILFTGDTEQFLDHGGKAVGPFKSGELANLNNGVASILVTSGKASFVDEA